MKKTRKNKTLRKLLKKNKKSYKLSGLMQKSKKGKKITHNKGKKKSKAKKRLKSKLNTRKKNKMAMKGGAIPFSELNPSLVLGRITDHVGGHFSDKALMVPNNLESTSSVVDHPHLDAAPEVGLGVTGASSLDHFAPV